MGLMDIIGSIFGGAGGQNNLLSSLLTSGLAAGAGALNNRPVTTTFQKQSDPRLDPQTLGLRNNLIKQSQSLLGNDPDLRGYTAQGLSNINAGSNAQNKVLNQTLASRGLEYSPLASAEQANLGNEQYKQSTDFLNQVPLLKNQLLQQRLASVTNTFRSLPYGEKSSGKQVVSGNMLGGALTGLLAALASKKKPGSGFGGGGGGTGSGGGSPLDQQLNEWWKQIIGSPSDPTQQQQPSQIDTNIFYPTQSGGGTSGLDSPTIFDQNLPGAPPYYDPNPTVFSGPFDLGGGYGNFSGYDLNGGGGGYGGGGNDFSQPGMFDL